MSRLRGSDPLPLVHVKDGEIGISFRGQSCSILDLACVGNTLA